MKGQTLFDTYVDQLFHYNVTDVLNMLRHHYVCSNEETFIQDFLEILLARQKNIFYLSPIAKKTTQ